MPGSVFWGVVYLGVAASALLRRYRQSRSTYAMGDAGWREDHAKEYSEAPRGYVLAREARQVVGFVREVARDVIWFACDLLDALTG